MREMIVKILQRDFDVVTSVKMGPAAIEATNSLNPDVLVVDVRMHGLDGGMLSSDLWTWEARQR
jgi:CheY-like chemotaxis protein